MTAHNKRRHVLPVVSLDDEERRRVADCLRKDGIALAPGCLARFVRDIEESIAAFLANADRVSFREAREALGRLWKLSQEGDLAIGQLRALIQALPTTAAEYVDGRFPIRIRRSFLEKPRAIRFRTWAGFRTWARAAEPSELIFATRVLTGQGARVVKGRSRGQGQRSRHELEPIIKGEARGAGGRPPIGGRPANTPQYELVMFLALDWLHATGKRPTPGRSAERGFGDLVYSVFDWLCLPEGSAAYSLRKYWAEAKQAERRKPPRNH